MVYLVGIIGFLCGFVLSLLVLARLLKDRSNRELTEDKSLQWHYGLLAWLIAGFTSYAAISLYKIYFPG